MLMSLLMMVDGDDVQNGTATVVAVAEDPGSGTGFLDGVAGTSVAAVAVSVSSG